MLLGTLAAWPALPRAAFAADDDRFPERPIRCVLPAPVGGTSDLLVRLLAPYVGERLGQPLVAEARPGAAGRIALDQVARADPDGYTLLLANNANSIVLAGRGTPPADLVRLFAPVTMLVRLPIVVVVTPALGVDTLQALVARARRMPGAISYASSGRGSTSHMAATLLFRRAGVRLLHVPYSGTAAAVKDVLSGEVPVLFSHLGTVAGLLQAGQLEALAVTGERRAARFPQVPTVAESGFPGFDVTTWHGIVVPAGTGRRVIAQLRAALVGALAVPAVATELPALGMEAVGDTPEQFGATLRADVERWAAIIRDGGIVTE